MTDTPGPGDDPGVDAGDEDAIASQPVDPGLPSRVRIGERPPRSGLAGSMRRPVSRAIRIRRSTVVLVVAFLVCGGLSLWFPPAAKVTAGTGSGSDLPGILPAVTTTTTTSTVPPATTAPSTSTTAPPPTSASSVKSTTSTSTTPRSTTTTSTTRSTTTTTTTTTLPSVGATTTTATRP